METGSEEFAKQIGDSATERLTKSLLGTTFVTEEQGGVKITEDELLNLSPELQTQLTNLLGITGLAAQLRHSLFEQASLGVIKDSSESTLEPRVISNQNEFIQELLGKNPKLIDKLAEITAKARIFKEALGQQTGEITQKIDIKVNTWEHTIDEIALSLCSNETEKSSYKHLVEGNIEKLNNPSQRIIRGASGQPQIASVESYASKLKRLIKNPRAVELISSHMNPEQGKILADSIIDEYLETAFTLNTIRVLDRIQRPLGFNGKFRKLTSCLRGRETDPAYARIIESNGLDEIYRKLTNEIKQVKSLVLTKEESKEEIKKLNDNFRERCLPILQKSFSDEKDDEEAIDIVDVKNRITDLMRQANEINLSSSWRDEKKSD